MRSRAPRSTPKALRVRPPRQPKAANPNKTPKPIKMRVGKTPKPRAPRAKAKAIPATVPKAAVLGVGSGGALK